MFSSGLIQGGDETEGIVGFMPPDVDRWVGHNHHSDPMLLLFILQGMRKRSETEVLLLS